MRYSVSVLRGTLVRVSVYHFTVFLKTIGLSVLRFFVLTLRPRQYNPNSAIVFNMNGYQFYNSFHGYCFNFSLDAPTSAGITHCSLLSFAKV